MPIKVNYGKAIFFFIFSFKEKDGRGKVAVSSDSKEFIKQTGHGLVMVLLYVLDRINDDLLYKYKLGNIKQITLVTEEYFASISLTDPNYIIMSNLSSLRFPAHISGSWGIVIFLNRLMDFYNNKLIDLMQIQEQSKLKIYSFWHQ